MLFSIVNAFMMLILAIGLGAAYVYYRDRKVVDSSVSAFIAIVCSSLFCAYVMVLGFSAAFNDLFKCISHSVSAFKALFSH